MQQKMIYLGKDSTTEPLSEGLCSAEETLQRLLPDRPAHPPPGAGRKDSSDDRTAYTNEELIAAF